MANPFSSFFALLLSDDKSMRAADLERHKIVAFSCIMAFIAALYSIIKWYKLGYNDLANWAWLIIIGSPVVAVLNKHLMLPGIVLANMSVLLMAIYCGSLIYHLDGLASPHVFWLVGVMVFAFLITDNRCGLIWFGILSIMLLTMIVSVRNGFEFPSFELDEKQTAVNIYSGYLLPTIVIGFALWYSNRIRHEAIGSAENAAREALSQTEKSKALSGHMGEILQNASQSADTLLSSSDQLSITMQDMLAQSAMINEHIASQVDSTQQMNSTLATMADSVDRSSGLMQEVSHDMGATQHDISETASAMNQAIENMQHIRESHDAILDSMKIISDIANQTNLLALNAAIEAARAGDQGRGFAVVADEVRTLSIRSNESAQQIRELLDAATNDIEQGSDAVNMSGERLERAVQAFTGISGKITSATEISGQQYKDIEGIVTLSAAVDQLMQENEQAVHELINKANLISGISADLGQVAHEMNEIVHRSDKLV